jgi:hypothetical protein
MTKKTTTESKMVEANGKEICLPSSLKRKSPGKRPMPNFSSQGSSLEKTINTTKITTTQRIIETFPEQTI